MRVGYKKALELLFTEYENLQTKAANPNDIKSIKEGIKYLCYPYREDLTKDIRSPIQDPDDDSLNPLKADRSTPEKEKAFHERMAEQSKRNLDVKLYALEILNKL